MSTPQVFFNPLDPDVRANPYPHYAELRAVDPVHRSPFGLVVLTRYDDCAKVLRDARFSADIAANANVEGVGLFGNQDESQAGDEGFNESLLNLDPPKHTRVRGLAAARVHAEGHRGVATPGRRDGRRDPRQGRGRRRVRPCEHSRLPAAVPGDLRAPRHADRPARRAPGVVAGDHAHPRAVDLRGGARWLRPKRQSTCASSSRR